MSHWLEHFFSRRTDGALVLRSGTAIHHQTTAGTYVYPDRYIVLDSFNMVETMIAKYTVICEAKKTSPIKIDTFELTVLANRDNAVFTINQRAYSDRILVDVRIEQDNQEVYVKLKEHDYGDTDIIKVSLIRNYIDTVGT